MDFLRRLNPSQLDQRHTPSFLRAHPLPDTILRRQLDVGCQFLVEFPVERRLTKE
jgi:hypothetical protein